MDKTKVASRDDFEGKAQTINAKTTGRNVMSDNNMAYLDIKKKRLITTPMSI